MPKLAERVRRLISAPDSKAEETLAQISLLEERLAGYGLETEAGKVESGFFMKLYDVYEHVTFYTKANKGWQGWLAATVTGKIGMTKKQLKPRLDFSKIFMVHAHLECDGKPLITLSLGERCPYEDPFLPEYAMIRNTWERIHSLLPRVNFNVIPEDRRHRRMPKDYAEKAYSLEEVQRRRGIDPRILAVHRAVGPNFFYATKRDGTKEPRTYHLTLKQPGVSGTERFKTGVDALCRIIENYRELRG